MAVFNKLDPAAVDSGFTSLRKSLLGEWEIPAADTRGRHRPYSLAVHGACLAIVGKAPATFQGLRVDPAEGRADEEYLKGLEESERRLGSLLTDLRAQREAVKERMLDRSDTVTNTLRAIVLDPRTAPLTRQHAKELLSGVDAIIESSNSAIRARARLNSDRDGKVAELETEVATLRDALDAKDDGDLVVRATPVAARRAQRR